MTSAMFTHFQKLGNFQKMRTRGAASATPGGYLGAGGSAARRPSATLHAAPLPPCPPRPPCPPPPTATEQRGSVARCRQAGRSIVATWQRGSVAVEGTGVRRGERGSGAARAVQVLFTPLFRFGCNRTDTEMPVARICRPSEAFRPLTLPVVGVTIATCFLA